MYTHIPFTQSTSSCHLGVDILCQSVEPTYLKTYLSPWPLASLAALCDLCYFCVFMYVRTESSSCFDSLLAAKQIAPRGE